MDDGTRASYDAVATRYAGEIGAELSRKALDRALLDALAELAEAGPIADLGCGPGQVGGYLVDAGRWVIGADVSVGMLTIARETAGLPVVAGDLAALPFGSDQLAGIACFYAVIHLDAAGRAQAYAEFARVLRGGGYALIAFHVSDDNVTAGGSVRFDEWWEHPVALTFHYLDPAAEASSLAAAGLDLVARLDREPDPAVEHASRRSYLLVRKRAQSDELGAFGTENALG